MKPAFAIRLLKSELRTERDWLESNLHHRRNATSPHTRAECFCAGNIRSARRRVAHLEAAIATLERKR